MNNPKVYLIIAILAAIIYIVSFFQEQNLMNGIGAIVFLGLAIGAYTRFKKFKK
tara:strand:+ start:1824 stop:1985 length:162 start_codon:yes stop_codon:yes gene_type:complete